VVQLWRLWLKTLKKRRQSNKKAVPPQFLNAHFCDLCLDHFPLETHQNFSVHRLFGPNLAKLACKTGALIKWMQN